MFDPMLDARVVEQRKQDLLRQARLHHMRRELLTNRRLLHRRWMAMMADLMIVSGTRLKARFGEKPAPAAHRPDTVAMDMGWDRL